MAPTGQPGARRISAARARLLPPSRPTKTATTATGGETFVPHGKIVVSGRLGRKTWAKSPDARWAPFTAKTRPNQPYPKRCQRAPMRAMRYLSALLISSIAAPALIMDSLCLPSW